MTARPRQDRGAGRLNRINRPSIHLSSVDYLTLCEKSRIIRKRRAAAILRPGSSNRLKDIMFKSMGFFATAKSLTNRLYGFYATTESE
jgi:hypothetical protein